MKDLKTEMFDIIQNKPEMLQYMQEIAGNCVWIWDMDNDRNGWFSPTFWQWLGYSEEEVVEKNLTWDALVLPDDIEVAGVNVKLHIENAEYPYDILIRYYHKNGTIVSMRCRGRGVRGEDGRVHRMVGTLVKVDTSSPIASFIDPNNFYELDLFFNLSDGLFCVTNLEGNIVRVNNSWADLLGYSSADLLGKKITDFAHYNDKGYTSDYFALLKNTDKKVQFTSRFITKKGEVCFVELRSVRKGQQVFTVASDITEKIAAQRELQDSQNFIEKILKVLPSYIFIYDLELNKVVFSNPWISKYFKDSDADDEIKRSTIFGNLVHEEDRIVVSQLIHEMATAEDDVITERRIRLVNTPIGTRYFKMNCLVFKRDARGKVIQFCGKAQDVTSLVYAENKLIESEENQRALLEHGGDLYIVTTPTKLKYVSPNLTKILGYTEDEFRLIPLGDLVHPDDFPLRWDELRNPNDSITFEYRIKHKNGYYLWIEAFGINLFHVKSVEAMVFNLRDISDRKKHLLELERQSDLLERKNKELEQFAYIASHDLQEPLRNITALIELITLSAEEKLNDEEKEYLEFIDRSTGRMSQLIKGLLGYAKIGTEMEMEQVDLNELINHVLEDLKLKIEETNANFELSNLPKVKAYASELRQLFQNLFTNAIKFAKPGVAPQIKIRSIEEADRIVIEVKDNGVGVPIEGRDKMFTIFNRLHSRHEYEGSGIGLAHCKKIVDLHKGDIWFESEVGVGSSFFFTISK